MVKINKIYTRTGDDGTTGLVGGDRIAKDHPRVNAYGDVDELNSLIGWARTLADESKLYVLLEKLEKIQHQLFDIGAILASPAGATHSSLPTINEIKIKQLESWIDDATADLPELRSFVLPGGNQLNCSLHLARAVCRRTERAVLSLSRTEDVPKEILIYLNRLSDLLFAFARFASMQTGAREYLWSPS